MPIYEYYCPDNHTVYQFYAKTLAQGRTIPRCPDNPAWRMMKQVSAFSVTGAEKKGEAAPGAEETPAAGGAGDARMEAAMGAMEKEMAGLDENDPRAMARMMRRMGGLTGEKFDEPTEEMVRKLEEGADPDSLDETFGGDAEGGGGAEDEFGGPGANAPSESDGAKEKRAKFRVRRGPPVRDPKLYDYE